MRSRTQPPLGRNSHRSRTNRLSTYRRTTRRRQRTAALFVAVVLAQSFGVIATAAGAATAPGAPTAPSAGPGNAQATVRWTAAPANGSPITAYVVTPFVGTTAQPASTFNSAATTEIVTGLTNATTYTFRVAAKNAIGTGPQSVTTTPIVVGAPSKPGAPTAIPGNAQATVSWNAPAPNGSAITAYVVTPYVGATAQAARSFNSTATTQIITGLTNKTSYTFNVAAKNARGTGPPSVTAPITVGAPKPPTAPSAVATNSQATVKWTAPANNGSPITGYLVTPFVGTTAQTTHTFNSTATTQTITGLASATTYTFKIAAKNANGIGPRSVPTNAVTPSSISFGQAVLQGTTSTSPTVLRFGPDGRLYVAQFNGLIIAYTVTRVSTNAYSVTASETINAIQQIPNHNDDGTLAPSVTTRQITGLLVVGSANSPIIYVSSSDPRIGGGTEGTQTNLDTNSGIVSRLTHDGTGWHRQDVVRGLPRSEENHATNALVLDQTSNTLYVAQGGNTNMGAPSHNFNFLPEYAYSGAVLKVDLSAIGTTTYDLPTLVDEDHPGLVGPFGGDLGKHQAKITPSSPVQVYSPGYRNPFSLVRTRTGSLYAWDNGANAGWGDIPIGAGPTGQCSNASNEPGVHLNDSLHRITGQGYYAGHPNPTRGNKANTFNTTNPQSPVPTANPKECDARTPTTNGSIANTTFATTGMAEYTTANLGGQLDGDLITATWQGSVLRDHLSPDGTKVLSAETLFSNVATHPIDVAVQSDSQAYPGTIWVPDFADGSIHVFEPADFGGRTPPACSGADSATLDEDHDGYTNADEIDNGTDPCSAADEPHDWNHNFVSDRNDPNDDSDALPDVSDPFPIDASNGLSTAVPISYAWQNGAPVNPCAPTPTPSGCPGGLLGLGFTGLMSNGVTNYNDMFDPRNMTVGGAAGVLTVAQVPPGDPTGSGNSQQYAFQYGVNADPATTGVFTAHTRIDAPFAGVTPQGNQSIGFYIGTGDQDNYVKVVLTANGGHPGIRFVEEVGRVVTTGPLSPLTLPGPDSVDLYLTVDPAAATVTVRFRVTTGGASSPIIDVGKTPTLSFPASWVTDSSRGLALGVIATSAGGPTFPATWSVLEATSGPPGP
jgi:hypothetical protein